jgi:hypothetical protein
MLCSDFGFSDLEPLTQLQGLRIHFWAIEDEDETPLRNKEMKLGVLDKISRMPHLKNLEVTCTDRPPVYRILDFLKFCLESDTLQTLWLPLPLVPQSERFWTSEKAEVSKLMCQVARQKYFALVRMDHEGWVSKHNSEQFKKMSVPESVNVVDYPD